MIFFFLTISLGVTDDLFRNQDNNQWYMDGVKLIEENLKIKPNTNTAKSAILFLGDGMGISTITATRFLVGQSKGKQGEETVLSWELFPWTALAKTYAVNLQGTDSASSATAFLNGIKTNEGTFIKNIWAASGTPTSFPGLLRGLLNSRPSTKAQEAVLGTKLVLRNISLLRSIL